MTKISWTCPNCGTWHSMPQGRSWPADFSTYDGLPRAKTALEGFVAFHSFMLSPESRVLITSVPLETESALAKYLNPAWKTAKEPRLLKIDPILEDRLYCPFCEFDATNAMKVSEQKSTGTIIEMVPA